jgi:hypothetical protein
VESFVARHPTLVVYRAVLSLAHLRAGDPNAGVAEFERLAHDGFNAVPRDIMAFSTLCLLAEACALIGDTERAPVLYTTLLPHRARNVQVGLVTCLGSAERFLGLLAAAMSDWEAARDHFESALAKNASSGLRSTVPTISREYAEMLLARGAAGDVERARELLHQTRADAEAAGMTGLAAITHARIEETAASMTATSQAHDARDGAND